MNDWPKQILCIYLPSWPITRKLRRWPELQHDPAVVVETIKQRREVLVASTQAMQNGVRPGMTLSEARALCIGLQIINHDPAADARALEALGRWMTRFTPTVAMGWSHEDLSEEAQPTHLHQAKSLFLDLTGCERFFGGIHIIIEQVRRALARFKIPARVAVAPTVGAAWALASSNRQNGLITSAQNLRETVAPLPVASLRLSEHTIAALHHLGLNTIAQLLAMPRESLPSRFGDGLLLRLDQLLGTHPELLLPIAYEVAVEAKMIFDSPVDSLESLWEITHQLLERVVHDLTHRSHGAKEMQLICLADHMTGQPPITRFIPLSRPTQNLLTLARLLRCAIEQIHCGEGFVCIQLKIPFHERISAEQIHFTEDQCCADQLAVDRLIERLSVRFGQVAVRSALVESHLPERAWQPVSATSKNVIAVTAILPAHQPPRPLQLFTTPAEVLVMVEPSDDCEGEPLQFSYRGEVHWFSHVVGPERIAGEWWRGHRKTRDYYEVEDDAGQRFWIFRIFTLTSAKMRARWFLHGIFA